MKKPFPEILFLLLISAVVYLPRIGELTYFKDDWYYIYDGVIGGARVFHEMFRIDRPARGFFFEWYFALFGPNPLPWHVGAFLWRGLSAVGALWIFDMLWRGARRFNFLAALLFAIYPGYFWWISAIEYQPMIASLALQVFSIAFTLKAVRSQNRIERIAYPAGAILTGWAYIALVDYAIGMEVFRFVAVYLLVNRDRPPGLWKRFSNAVKAWAWTLIVPLGFLLWRIFIFENERRATDIGAQLGGLLENPLGTAVFWFFQLYNSLLNLGVLAWLDQFPGFIQGLRLRDTALGLFIAAAAVLLVVLAERMIKPSAGADAGEGGQERVGKEALLLGGLGMVFGVLPVIMANRYVTITGFSHYGLPASIAAAVFLVAFLEALSLRGARVLILYAIVAFAALAHFGIAAGALTEETALQKFWWQVSWRAPSLRPGMTLAIHYPLPGMGDDGNGVMEAANLIYFPEPTYQIPVHYNMSAVTLNETNLQEILLGKLFRQTTYRSHTVDFNFENVLVISQPTLFSCVHVIDGRRPLISPYDPVNVKFAAPHSNVENVVTDAEPSVPQSFAFGEEPQRKWCFYYQKAELALQLEDLDEVVAIGEEAIRLGFHPEDPSEWLPFVRAYAVTGNVERMQQTASKVTGDRFLRQQACDMLNGLEEPLIPEIRGLIATHYCRSAPK
jgi:hypothetical protein